MRISQKKHIGKDNSRQTLIPLQVKVCFLSTLAASSIILALPSSAADGSNSSTSDPSSVIAANSSALAVSAAQTSADANACNNPANINGLAYASANKWQDMQKLITADVGVDKMFDMAKQGGCFNALANFPNLSIAIPSLTSIANSLKQTMIDYAKRKACAAVNDALTDMLAPVNKVIDQISANGQLDLTGAVNKKLSDTYYSIDPQLGQIAGNSSNSGYSWSLQNDVINAPSSNTSTNTGSVAYTAPNNSQSVSQGQSTNSTTQNRKYINSILGN